MVLFRYLVVTFLTVLASAQYVNLTLSYMSFDDGAIKAV